VDNGFVLIAYAVMTLGAYVLVPILLIILMIPLAVAGFIASMFAREKWK
jgi:hypothetical protein